MLASFGFPYGRKNTIIKIPEVIFNHKDKTIKIAFLRGLFDTDGSLSFDRKTKNSNLFKKNRHYYPRISFSTTSQILALQTIWLLQELGFTPSLFIKIPKKIHYNISYEISLCGKNTLFRWISEISPANPIKLSRYYVWQKYGFCPPKTTYEQRQKILKGELNPDNLYGLVMQPG